jgi:uncharacterized protein (DUF1330 family)
LDLNMPAFLVGTVRISDPDRFGAYAAAIRGLSAEFGGEPVVAGAVHDVLEGDSPIGERVVVTRFPSQEDAKAYLQSPRYLEAKALRSGAATVELRLILT